MIAPDVKLDFTMNEIRLADGRTVGEAMKHDQWIVDDVLRPIYEVDAAGLPAKRLGYFELARGQWKTGAVAAVATTEAALEPDTDVVVAAADREQAGILLEVVDGYLARNPELAALFQRRGDERYTPSGSRIRIISSDAPTAMGLGGTHRRFRLILEELTVHASDALYTSLISATGKVRNVQTLILSNAGFQAETSWQWQVREKARTAEWGYLYAPPGIVASWITEEWVAQMRELLPSAAFERLIGNVWSTGVGDFVSEAQWARCVDERLAPRVRGVASRHHAGLDLGLTRDRTALAIVHRDGDDDVVLDDLQVWQGTRAEPVSIVAVERALVDTAGRFSGLRVSADPWQLKGSIEKLRGHLHINEFVFSSSSVAKLSAALHHAITSARLRVFPDDDLTREILALRVVETSGGWRFDHKVGGFSDRAVAIAMAILAAQSQPSGAMTSTVPRGRIPNRAGQGGTYADRVARSRHGGTDQLEDVARLVGVPIYRGG